MFTNFTNEIDNIMKKTGVLSKDEADLLLEFVLDTLIEVGNGVTDEHLHEACDWLFKFRDYYFKYTAVIKGE